MAWLTNKDTGGHFNTDWLDKENKTKESQIAENKKQADERSQGYTPNKGNWNAGVGEKIMFGEDKTGVIDHFSEDGKTAYVKAGDKIIPINDEGQVINSNPVDEMIQNKQFSKLGNYLSQHRKEYGIGDNEDTHTIAYDIIKGERQLKPSQNANGGKQGSVKETEDDIKDNSKYAPSSDDVASPESYFEDTTVKVNTSLSDWTREADETLDNLPRRYGQVVSDYMENSSINNKMLHNKPLTVEDRQFIEVMDRFTGSGLVKKGTILYSGISQEDANRIWNSGDEVKYNAYLSTSPDPVYAAGYGMNTQTVLQIECTQDTKLGKCYYEDSTGTEGVLGRNKTYKVVGTTKGKIQGEEFKIIKVQI